MRVVSWNIELGDDIDLAAHELLSHAQLRSADVILVQEMSPASVTILSDLLGQPALYEAAASHSKTLHPFGNAILSRWPMRLTQHLRLPHIAPIDGMPRSALFATVDVSGDEVLVASVHIETVLLDLRRRRRQVATIAAHAALTNGPCIIGGDFNTASRRSLHAFEGHLAEAQLERLSRIDDQTFTRFGRPFVLDHIFGRGVSTIDGGVVETEASDHDPVWVELRLDAPHR